MSYTVAAYALDLDRLAEVYGSHDLDLVQAIEDRFADHIADYDEQALEWMDADVTQVDGMLNGSGDDPELALPLGQALREIVAGSLHQPEQAAQYSYALELLCMHLGVPLPNASFMGLRGTGIGFISELDGLGPLNYGSRQPLVIAALPAPQDFPTSTYLTTEEAAERLARFSLVPVHGDDAGVAPVQQWATEVREQYRSWLEHAVRTHSGLVMFLY